MAMSHVNTFDTGNAVYTTFDESCEYMNNHFADVGKKLHSQFSNNVLLNEYACNQSISTGIFPDSWAVATITPIPKAGNKHLANNWRPISIIPLIGKLMEK